ncbi:MAG: NAD(P)/FAD-dependent oxidoreductase [Chitinispirillaceae bacterium]|nr:NAD(P)/FAD-dependent oxidoreductase [Chitinispirillaceae bacterium]
MNVVIIGNGVAGVSAAETIRAADKECGITIVSDERHPFYSRPRVIEFLAGKATLEQIIIHAREWYERNAVELRVSTRIDRLDAEGKRISGGGAMFTYDKLVVAAGASCLVPPVAGTGAEEVVTLRTVDDAAEIRGKAAKSREAVVVGGGLLGLEAANGLLTLGVRVRVLELFDRLLPRQLDGESAEVLQKMLENKGMAFHVGMTVQSVERSHKGLLISCSDGTEVAADLAVVAAGIQPNCSVIEGSPVEWERGITVDDRMRTSVPDIYACGDAAEHRGIIYGLWQPAREQGIVCGANVLGKEARYGGTMNSVRLKVAGIELASIGEMENKEGVGSMVERDEAAGFYKKIFLRDRRIVGAILIGNTREAAQLQQKIKTGEKSLM